MFQPFRTSWTIAALALIGLACGCGSSSPAEKDSSPTGSLAEHFSDQTTAVTPAIASPKAAVSTPGKGPAEASKTDAVAPVPAQPDPPVLEPTVKNTDTAANPPPVNVNVQVNLPDHTRISTSGELEPEGTDLSVALPPQDKQGLPHPPESDRGRERFRRGPGMWRLYARLTEGERRELRELQLKDPERYRSVIRTKLDALYAEDMARREELRTLVRSYQETADSELKADLKRRMTLLVRSDFQRRLSENRLQFEDLRSRSIKLERELDKRAANAEAIIAHQVDELLSGQINLEDPRHGRPHSKDAPPKVMRPGHRPPPPPATQPAASNGKK